jgi:hypothetical protein
LSVQAPGVAMKIDHPSSLGVIEPVRAVQSLESRLFAAGREASSRQPEEPEFEHLYQTLLTLEGQGEKAIYDFIRSLRSADGSSAAYPTAQALMSVTLKLLVRLKDEQLDDSLLFKAVRGANGLAFSMDIFVKELVQEMFAPTDDESWEKSEW